MNPRLLLIFAIMLWAAPAPAEETKPKKKEAVLQSMNQRILDAKTAGETHEQTFDSIFDNHPHGDGGIVPPPPDKLLSGTAVSPKQALEARQKEEECIAAARRGKKKGPRCSGRPNRGAR